MRKPLKHTILVSALFSSLAGCGGGSSDTQGQNQNDKTRAYADSKIIGLNASQRMLADQFVEVFERSIPNGEAVKLRYNFAKNETDGHGITAGRSGFTSATGDMLEVIEKYTEKKPDNGLKKYLPELRRLISLGDHDYSAADGEDGSADATNLIGLEDAWIKEVEEENSEYQPFRRAQDEVNNKHYYEPAVSNAKKLGLKLPVSILSFYDTAIQHGVENDEGNLGLLSIISLTNSEMGGTPKEGMDEVVWLDAFLENRQTILELPTKKMTEEERAEKKKKYGKGNSKWTPTRAIELRQMLDDNKYLTSPYRLVIENWGGEEHTLVQQPVPEEPVPEPENPTINSPKILKNEIVERRNNVVVLNLNSDKYVKTVIKFGESTSYGRQVKEPSFKYKEHIEYISGLKAGTTYHYQVTITDKKGNTVVGKDKTFRTKGAPVTPPKPPVTPPKPPVTPPKPPVTPPKNPTINSPKILKNEIVERRNNVVVLNLNSDKYVKTVIKFGESTSYGRQVKEPSFKYKEHIEYISGLKAGTTYHYQVTITDKKGNTVVGKDKTFRTKGAPVVPPKPPVTPPKPVEKTITVSVNTGNDDAEEELNGTVHMTSSDLELIREDSKQVVGIRFAGVKLPQNANIQSAYIQFQADESDSEETNLILVGENSANASSFARKSHNISKRAKTSSSVAWSPEPWTVIDERSAKQRTPNLAPIVQEIINKQGWKNGNALSFIITGEGKRVARSFNKSKAAAAKLIVKYNTDSANASPVIVLKGSTSVSLHVGDSYQDSGATATGLNNASLHVEIAENTVDTSKSGTYIVKYKATDSANNKTSYATRTIIVQDYGVSTGEITRGPYLQQGTSNSMIIRWRTKEDSITQVNYGTSLSNFSGTASDNKQVKEHEIKVTGLSPSTRYYYQIADNSGVIQEGSDQYFKTSPSDGSNEATRIWVIGDSGTGSDEARNMYDAYKRYTQGRYTNLWLMLGDNAYDEGTDSEYQENVFDMFPEMLKQTPLWSAIGNHDIKHKDNYLNTFTFPKNGEVGGKKSGHETYYSFNYGNTHFVVLSSEERKGEGSLYDLDSGNIESDGMHQWLKMDLEANSSNSNTKWLVAMWHRPPYSKGSHDSDESDSMTAMRKFYVPLLEDYGVDIVLSGHSHAYERSKYIHGHYKKSDSFSSKHIVQDGDGKPNGNGAYSDANDRGTVYTVAGASGHATGGSLDHPVMQESLNKVGSVVLDIENDTLKAIYLDQFGNTIDSYQINK